MTTHSSSHSMMPALARTIEDADSNTLFDRLLNPEYAVPVGIAAGVAKGALVGLVTGKLLLCVTLGAVGGAVVGTLIRRAAQPAPR